MRVKPIKTSPGQKVSDLVGQMQFCGFGARRISTASDILERMVREKTTNFLGLAGAMVPAGMRQVVVDMLNDGWFQVFVTTGANLTHDLIEAIGGEHLIGTHTADDAALRKKEIDRIYDVFMPNKVYEKLEDWCMKQFPTFPKKMSIKQFLWEIGSRLDDKGSILYTCAKKKIPVFCPAISDCGIGMQVWNYQAQGNQMEVDAFNDLKELMDICWSSKSTGCLLIGGGVPKNHILQAMQFSPKEHSYAIQITTDRPEPGGLSGAELREAISWGKIGESAKYVDVICDATIALPLIVSTVKDRLFKK